MANVLAVDDSPSIRQLVSMTLQGAGHSVQTAEDGVIARELAQSFNADLVITDVHMPNMDGITLTSELRNLPGYRYKPILVLTTESSDEMKQKGKSAGATGWIVKPFDPQSLLNVMEKVLTR